MRMIVRVRRSGVKHNQTPAPASVAEISHVMPLFRSISLAISFTLRIQNLSMESHVASQLLRIS